MKIADSEQRFQRFVEARNGPAVYMLDKDGKLASWSAGAERPKLHSPCEIIGQDFSISSPKTIAAPARRPTSSRRSP